MRIVLKYNDTENREGKRKKKEKFRKFYELK